MSENLVNVIQNIRKGTTYGLNISGFSGLTDSNLSGLLEKVSKKEELEAFPDFVGGYIQPKELEILLSKNIIDSDGKTKNALSFLPENFLSQINKNIFLNLPDEYLQLITPEQFKLLPEKAAMQLAKDNRLQYLSNEVIKSLELQSLNLYHKYSVNITSDRLTEGELKAQLNSLIEAEKLQYLPKEIIGTITDEIIKGLGADFIKQLSAETLDYLATVKGDGLIITNQKICAIDINLVPIDKFEVLSPETIKALSVEQIKTLDTNHLSALKKKLELINALGNNFAAISDVTGLDINSLSEATLKNVTNEQFKQFGIEQFKTLCDVGKFKYLKPEIIEQIPNDYLVYAVERGLTNKQASHLNKEQFELIFNQNRGNIIIPEIIPSLRADVISANQEFLKNLTVEQAENLTAEQVKSIQKNGLLNILSDDVLFSVVNKIKDNLKELDEDVLTRVARNKSINSQILILDSEPVLTNFSVDFKSEENQIFNIKDIGATIKKRIEDEDWERLSSDCFFWCKDKKQKSEIYEILKEEINSQKQLYMVL